MGGMTIPLILASKSAPRRNVLYSAGVCPTIRVSHVDEPAALEHAAEQAGVGVDALRVSQRVMILAEAKAQAVYQAYRNVAEAAAAAMPVSEVSDAQAADLRFGRRIRVAGATPRGGRLAAVVPERHDLEAIVEPCGHGMAKPVTEFPVE